MSDCTGGDEEGVTKEYPAAPPSGPIPGKVWLAGVLKMTKALGSP